MKINNTPMVHYLAEDLTEEAEAMPSKASTLSNNRSFKKNIKSTARVRCD